MTYTLCLALAAGLLQLLPTASQAQPQAQAQAQARPDTSDPVMTWGLPELIELARRSHPALMASRARVVGAQAGLVTAAARPNPELDLQAGRVGATQADVLRGMSGSFGILQPLERSALRRSRQDVAGADLQAAVAGTAGFERSFIAELKLRYYEVLRLQAAALLAQEDLRLAEQIHSRVGVRVSSGEAPRFELIRADAERLNAQRAAQAAGLRVTQARADLARLVGPDLPASFAVSGSLADLPDVPAALQTLRTEMRDRHPELLSARAELAAAQARVEYERQRALPSFAVRAATERVPGAFDTRLGVVMSLPLFDRREGPIAQAQAEVERARGALMDRELALEQSLTVAWQRYQNALAQVNAYESGILREAQSALRVAEAAYRYGERGILDYLDAQRTLRSLRIELNTTRYELYAARVELERLRPDAE